MKTKAISAAFILACAPLAFAGAKAAYPSEKVAAFVVERLDVTSLPSAIRPKKEKGKKTLADYGYTAQKVEEQEAIVEAPEGAAKLSLTILGHGPAGIYVCIALPGQNGETKTQSVVLLKRKDSESLLKGRVSFREFASCPVIGAADSTADSYGGD